ncbi:hypothetical protein, partial [Leptospira alexanderi]|uniref:hypothetical protein n=1 Tax=Leptospira alexanderi TaxID=100053 RepID=UPI0011157B37
SARKWACYATAGQLAAMAGYAAIYGAPGYGIPGYTYDASGEAFGSLSAFELTNGLSIETLVLYVSIPLTIKSAIQGDWTKVGTDLLGYAIDKPISLAVNYAKGTVRTCEGDL